MKYSRHFEHKRSPDLDGARGVLAFCVVLFHFGLNSFISRATHGLVQGFSFRLCVDAFFILSGYVLTGSMQNTRVSAVNFARKRLFRLGPIFFLTTVAALKFPAPDYIWTTAPLELIAGQPIIGHDAANGPSWSVTWEFYLPALACAASPWLPKLGRLECRVILIFSLAGLALLDMPLGQTDGSYFARAALGLLSGHMLFGAKLRRAVDWKAWMTPALLAALIAIMFAAMASPIAALAFPVVVCAMVLSGTANDSWLLSNRVAQWLGAISYTLYLVHVPVMRIGEILGGAAFAQNPLAKCLGIGISLICAWALTKWVEVPFIDLGRRRAIVSGPATADLGISPK